MLQRLVAGRIFHKIFPWPREKSFWLNYKYQVIQDPRLIEDTFEYQLIGLSRLVESFRYRFFSQDGSRDAPPGSQRKKKWHERGVQYAKRARFPASLNIDV